MKKYIVLVEMKQTEEYEVEASSPEEAMALYSEGVLVRGSENIRSSDAIDVWEAK